MTKIYFKWTAYLESHSLLMIIDKTSRSCVFFDNEGLIINSSEGRTEKTTKKENLDIIENNEKYPHFKGKYVNIIVWERSNLSYIDGIRLNEKCNQVFQAINNDIREQFSN